MPRRKSPRGTKNLLFGMVDALRKQILRCAQDDMNRAMRIRVLAYVATALALSPICEAGRVACQITNLIRGSH